MKEKIKDLLLQNNSSSSNYRHSCSYRYSSLSRDTLKKVEKSRDLINVRAACTDIIAMGKTGYKTDIVREVELTQKKDDWQAFDSVTIAGITHKKSDPDTDNWKGIPKAGGVCEISYNKEKNTVVFNWKGSKAEESTIDFSSNLHSALNNSGLLENDLKNRDFLKLIQM